MPRGTGAFLFLLIRCRVLDIIPVCKIIERNEAISHHLYGLGIVTHCIISNI